MRRSSATTHSLEVILEEEPYLIDGFGGLDKLAAREEVVYGRATGAKLALCKYEHAESSNKASAYP